MTFFGRGDAAADFSHLGMVVPDMAAAQAMYSAAFGFRWSEVNHATPAIKVAGRPMPASVQSCYSVDGPPYLELIVDVTGEVWSDQAYGLNHMGVWVEDMAAAQERLARTGLPAVIEDASSTPPFFSYHRGEHGLWVELVAVSYRPRILERIRRAQDALAANGDL
jgi:catechol 2,3-dioxygenase-like lactoylglutathione lyase family enzyme